MYTYVLVCTGMYSNVPLLIYIFGRYLGLFWRSHRSRCAATLYPGSAAFWSYQQQREATRNCRTPQGCMEKVVRPFCYSSGGHFNDHHVHRVRCPLPRNLHCWYGTCQDDWWSNENAHVDASLHGSRPHRSRGSFVLVQCSTYQYVLVWVCRYLFMPVCTHTYSYWYVLYCNSFKLVFTRFSSSIRLFIKPRKDLVRFTACCRP